MRILHTSDWHLGKKLMSIDRLHEQREVLDEIHTIARNNNVDVVIVAGDIFDTAMPSADAEELFFESMAALGRERLVVVLAGNHDDPVRLCAAKNLAKVCNIVLAGDIADITIPTQDGTSDTAQDTATTPSAPKIDYYTHTTPVGHDPDIARVVGSSNGYIEIECRAQRAIINLLPYPSDSRMGTSLNQTSTYTQRVQERLHEGAKGFRSDTINITTTHLFCQGGIKEGDERDIELGTAKIIPLSALPPSHYTALGHIHKHQTLSSERHIYYSGAIMQYSFEDKVSDKCVIIADLDTTGVKSVTPVKLTRGRQLAKVTASSIDDAQDQINSLSNHWVALTLVLDRPLTESETRRLRNNHSNIALLKLENTSRVSAQPKDQTLMRTDKEIFVDYVKKVRGKEPDPKLTALFLSLMED